MTQDTRLPPCKGPNCGATDGVSHSPECEAQQAAAIAGGTFVPAPAAAQALPVVLGEGRYVIQHSAAGHTPQIMFVHATDEDRASLEVGESRDNPPGDTIHPEQVAGRILFAGVAGLDALETQLRMLRQVHFPDTGSAQAQPCDHLFEARPFDGSRSASVSCELFCVKCGYRPLTDETKGAQR